MTLKAAQQIGNDTGGMEIRYLSGAVRAHFVYNGRESHCKPFVAIRLLSSLVADSGKQLQQQQHPVRVIIKKRDGTGLCKY